MDPLQFNWSADAFADFYARIADEAPVDRVVIGETVCSKRTPFYEDRIPEAIERLQSGGKEVILGSLAMVTLEREKRAAARTVRADRAGGRDQRPHPDELGAPGPSPSAR